MRTTDTIPDLLVKNLPRGLLIGVEEALATGAKRAFAAARGMDEGHLPHVVGQLRHFHMNEAFQRSLAVSDASPSPICGNGIVTGKVGVFRLARLNVHQGIWNNGRRSKTRRRLARVNISIEPLVQPDFFRENIPPAEAVVFFVACFSNSLQIQPDSPISIQVAVPDPQMRYWLFKESLEDFAKRYEEKVVTQDDLARPKLKKDIGKRVDKDGTTL